MADEQFVITYKEIGDFVSHIGNAKSTIEFAEELLKEGASFQVHEVSRTFDQKTPFAYSDYGAAHEVERIADWTGFTDLERAKAHKVFAERVNKRSATPCLSRLASVSKAPMASLISAFELSRETQGGSNNIKELMSVLDAFPGYKSSDDTVWEEALEEWLGARGGWI